jgi:G:T-mismatch repair DNA endonuclease (very short patch repair protein)
VAKSLVGPTSGLFIFWNKKPAAERSVVEPRDDYFTGKVKENMKRNIKQIQQNK